MSKAAFVQQQVSDDRGGWKYFSPMLHIDDDDLDPYEYRLLGHYRRVCGVNGGKCTESAETSGLRTKMSAGKVSMTRKSLAQKARISLEYTNYGTVIVRLRDCWLENIQRYTKIENAPSPDEAPLHVVKPSSSSPSPDEAPLHVVKQRITNIEQPDNKQSEREKEFSRAYAHEVISVAQETNPAQIPIQEPESSKPEVPKVEPPKLEPPKVDLWEFCMKRVWPGGEKWWRHILNMMLGRSKTGQWQEYNFEEALRPQEPAEIIAFKRFMDSEEDYEDMRFPEKAETIYKYWGIFKNHARHNALLNVSRLQLSALLNPIQEPDIPDVIPPRTAPINSYAAALAEKMRVKMTAPPIERPRIPPGFQWTDDGRVVEIKVS
jgi:hypothetical protein